MRDTVLISAAKTRPLFQRELLIPGHLLPAFGLGLVYGRLCLVHQGRWAVG